MALGLDASPVPARSDAPATPNVRSRVATVARSARTAGGLGAWVVGILGLYVVAYLAWVTGHWFGDPAVVSDAAPIPLSGLAAALAWRASTRPALGARTRRA